MCELEGRREKGTYDDLRGDFGVLGASRDGLDEALDGESIRHESLSSNEIPRGILKSDNELFFLLVVEGGAVAVMIS